MTRAAAEALAGIDWAAPWLAPWRALGEALQCRVMQGTTVAAALNEGLARRTAPQAARSLCFVAHDELPAGSSYETHIADTGRVPTRDNPHDFFNGLAWLHHTRLKRCLNDLHATQLRQHGIGATRGAVRDVLTLFDENAAWLQLPAVLVGPFACRDWVALFVTHRAAWADARVGLFGHALIEKLCSPRKAITAHAWLVPWGLAPDQVEPWLVEMLARTTPASPRPLPLPVLGVPGWWHANTDPAYYDDKAVFRPPPVSGSLDRAHARAAGLAGSAAIIGS